MINRLSLFKIIKDIKMRYIEELRKLRTYNKQKVLYPTKTLLEMNSDVMVVSQEQFLLFQQVFSFRFISMKQILEQFVSCLYACRHIKIFYYFIAIIYYCYFSIFKYDYCLWYKKKASINILIKNIKMNILVTLLKMINFITVHNLFV